MRKSLNTSFFLLLFLVVISSCSKFSRLQKKGTHDEKYQAALKYYEKKDYYKAGLLFEELIPFLKGNKESEIAQFYLAYCQYYQQDYVLAQHHFKQFYETYGRSEFVEEAQYMYAYSLYKDSPNYNLDQSNTYTALEALQSFINTHPKSKYREQGSEIIADLRRKLETKAYEIAKLYYKVGSADISNYKAAVIAFDNFQKNFPDSDYNEELAYLKIIAEYELAKNSTPGKRKERYGEAVKYYEAFIDKYPASKYLKDAERTYSNCVDEIGQLTSAANNTKP